MVGAGDSGRPVGLGSVRRFDSASLTRYSPPATLAASARSLAHRSPARALHRLAPPPQAGRRDNSFVGEEGGAEHPSCLCVKTGENNWDASTPTRRFVLIIFMCFCTRRQAECLPFLGGPQLWARAEEASFNPGYGS